MSGYFRFSRSGRDESDPWFRIGTLEIGTTMLVVLISVISLVVYAVEPIDKPIETALAMLPSDVTGFQLWRLVTWPFANLYVDLWVAVSIFFFWYFGTELERMLGRVRFAIWFFGTTVLVGLLNVVLYLVLPFGIAHGGLAGLQSLGILVLLVFIAEYPLRRFFFNIPGWVIGLIYIGITVIQYLGVRQWFELIAFLLSLVVAALMARSVGLLQDQTWLPNLAVRRRPRTPKKQRRRPTGPTVVAGPWEQTLAPVSRDQAALDALLDKISATGMDSLSDREREQLMELRERLRRR